jgi:hypothetical protein
MADLYAFFASSVRDAGVACAIAAGEKQAKANAVTRYERNRGFIRQGPQFLDFESVSRPAFDCEGPITTVWSLQPPHPLSEAPRERRPKKINEQNCRFFETVQRFASLVEQGTN